MQRGYDHGLAGRRSLALIHRCLPSLPRLSAGFTIRLHSAGSLTTTASAANGAGTVTTHPAWTACCGRASPSRPTPPPPATPDVRHVSRGRLQHHLSSSHAGRHLVNGQPPPNLGGSLLMPLILLSLQNRHPLPTTQLSLPRPIQQLAGMTMAHTVTARTVRNYRHGAATQKVGPTLSRNPTEVQAPTTEPGRLPNNRHFRQFSPAQGQHETYSSNQSFVLIGAAGGVHACMEGGIDTLSRLRFPTPASEGGKPPGFG